jgi:hypothetical protein
MLTPPVKRIVTLALMTAAITALAAIGPAAARGGGHSGFGNQGGFGQHGRHRGGFGINQGGQRPGNGSRSGCPRRCSTELR